MNSAFYEARLFDDLVNMDTVNASETIKLCREALGLATAESIVMKAMQHIGELWQQGELSLAQVYMSGVICENLISVLANNQPTMAKQHGRIGVVTLLDKHDPGKRMVLSMLRTAGYTPIDLGAGLTEEETAEKAAQEHLDILMISVFLLPTALRVQHVVELLEQHGGKPKVVVGGAPFNMDDTLWKRVGADACGNTASDAVNIAKMLLEASI